MSCQPWPIAWPKSPEAYEQSLQDIAVALAQDVLWAKTGRRFGHCTLTQTYNVDPGYCAPPGGYTPIRDAEGVWQNVAVFPAGELIQLANGPVRSVDGVVESGVALPTDDFQLLRGGILRRLGRSWGDPVVVTYQTGIPVPPAGAAAMGELAYELLLAMTGDKCRLPRNTVQVVRQGSTVTKESSAELRKEGLVGLPLSDMWIDATNPGRVKIAPKVTSPDMIGLR